MARDVSSRAGQAIVARYLAAGRNWGASKPWRSVALRRLLCCTQQELQQCARGAGVNNPLWSRPGVASVGIAIAVWAILLVVTIEAGRLTSMW
jgi:hypothetical protein